MWKKVVWSSEIKTLFGLIMESKHCFHPEHTISIVKMVVAASWLSSAGTWKLVRVDGKIDPNTW